MKLIKSNGGLLSNLMRTTIVVVTVALTWTHTETPLGLESTPTADSFLYPIENCTSTRRSQFSIVNYRPDEFMSPIAVKLLADAHYGTSSIPQKKQKEMDSIELRYIIGCLQPGAVIFVDTVSLNMFFKHYYDKIKVKFILVSGDSDLSAPEALDSESMTHKFLIPNSTVIHWFAMNCNRNPDPARFTCLMNGISQWNGQAKHLRDAFDSNLGIVASPKSTRGVTRKMFEFRAPHHSYGRDADANVSSFQRNLKTSIYNETREEESETDNRSRLMHASENSYVTVSMKNTSHNLLVSFDVASNIGVRKPAWDHFCNNIGKRTRSHCIFEAMPLSVLYRLVSSSRFVLSPHGVGLDCYRTYEALYLGAYGVVRKSSLDEIYKNLPVLIVDKWSDVTDQLLNDTYHRFLNTKFDFDKLFTKYWFHRFRSFGYDSYSYMAGPHG